MSSSPLHKLPANGGLANVGKTPTADATNAPALLDEMEDRCLVSLFAFPSEISVLELTQGVKKKTSRRDI